MTIVLTDNANYSAIASAIRGKNGTQATYAPSEMAAAIAAIPVGSATLGTKSITENGIYDATDDSLDGYSQVTVSVPSGGGGDVSGLVERSLSVVDCGSASFVGSYAFHKYGTLLSIRGDSVVTIGQSAIAECNRLTFVSFPSCVTIESSAFSYDYSLSAASFPLCTSIGSGAFGTCYNLTEINFPVLSKVGREVFASCTRLREVYLPACEEVSQSAFYSCTGISRVDLPICTVVSNSAFRGCKTMTSLSLPACVTIGNDAFENCGYNSSPYLTEVNLPACKSVGLYAFYGCNYIHTARLPVVSYLSSGAFNACYRLVSFYMTGISSVPNLVHSAAFSSTPIGGYSTTAGQYGSVFVPESLYADFLSHSVWSWFSSRIVSLTAADIAALEGSE